MELILVTLAAGLSTRFGGIKQLEPVGPSGEALLDYAIYDATRAGFTRVVLVIRPELEKAFHDHVNQYVGDAVRVSYAFQELDSIPSQFSVPLGRRKPWGTGHALLAAEEQVDGPFVMINADDFYGASSYKLLREHLEKTPASDIPEFAMVAYSLRDTLSQFGGVSRGVCECDTDGFIKKLVEVKNIEERDHEISGVTNTGDHYLLDGSETVSRGMFGFSVVIFPTLRQQFREFLTERGTDVDSEFLLTQALNEQISTKQARIKVFPARERSLGMTFREDKEYVVEQIAELVEKGRYQKDVSLWSRVNYRR